MTPATLRNPNRLMNVLSGMKQEKIARAKQKRVSTIARNIIGNISSLSPEQRTDTQFIHKALNDSLVPGATGEEIQMAQKMAFEHQSKAKKQKAYNRQTLLDERAEQKYQSGEKDIDIADQIRFPRKYGDVPAPSRETLLGEMSPRGRYGLVAGEKEAKSATAKTELNRRKIESEIAKNRRSPAGSTKSDLGLRQLWDKSYNASIKTQTEDYTIPVTPQMKQQAEMDANRVSGLELGAKATSSPFDDYMSTILKNKQQQGTPKPVGQKLISSHKPVAPVIQAPKTVEIAEPAKQKSTSEAVSEIAKSDESIKINKDLPANPTTWEVRKRLHKGKYVQTAKINGKLIPLTKEELSLYRKSKQMEKKGRLGRFLKSFPDAIEKKRKEHQGAN